MQDKQEQHADPKASPREQLDLQKLTKIGEDIEGAGNEMRKNITQAIQEVETTKKKMLNYLQNIDIIHRQSLKNNTSLFEGPLSRGSNDRLSHKDAASEHKSLHDAEGTNRSSSEQKTGQLQASAHRQESLSGFKSFRQDFNETIENHDHNSSKLLVQAEGLKLNETRFEDAEDDDQGVHEAQDQDRELQKMHMDFEENDTAPAPHHAQEQARRYSQTQAKDAEQLYDPYLDPEGSRFIDEHQIQVQHDVQVQAYEDRIDFYSHRIDENDLHNDDLYDSEGCQFQDFADETLQDIQNNSVYEKNVET